MEYRSFGNTGFKVSVFTLGAMRFLHGWDEPHDHLPEESLENCRQVLSTALKAGINLIETARGYGKSERLLGKRLANPRLPRQNFFCHAFPWNSSRPGGTPWTSVEILGSV